ncbi:endonuclease III [Geovibrio thiophilus]|uniref:Endonuclease III n=1 Tax=Geovibrio thiophilus TaxID=139438 RepID=A0A410JVU2_9BACT|nr:endonuclease III [Geovibrio thiophilus]QAR32141.1 endonuclease III [Geovibrio thiophilus]
MGNKKLNIDFVYDVLEAEYERLEKPSVTALAEKKRDPFRVLVSTIISLRTKDEVTVAASERLFAVADTPQKTLELDTEIMEKLIFPAGFYRNKTKTIKDISAILIEKYAGKVPADIDELVKLKGVGRKTANLVLVEGFQIPAVCVDIHVHRIFNRLGYLSTKDPDKTETELRKRLPQKYWIKLNEMMVTYGKYICRPVSPFCSACRLFECCDKVGVTTRR